MKRSLLFRPGAVLGNTLFFAANTLMGSILGFIFWAVVARQLEPTAVGLAAALVTAIGLMGSLGEMGLGIALIRFLATTPEKTRFLNAVSFTVVLFTGLFVLLFVIGLPFWSPRLLVLRDFGMGFWIFFGTAVFFNWAKVLDKVFVALQVSQYLFTRSLIANSLKIALVFILVPTFSTHGVVLAFGIGSAISLILTLVVFNRKIIPGYSLWSGVSWAELRSKMIYSLINHFSQLLWMVPALVYPLIIIQLLGEEANAYFYTSWMLANVLFILPTASSTSAFANTAKDTHNRAGFWRAMRLTLLILLPAVSSLVLLSPWLLNIFGAAYATSAQSLVTLLALSAFPYTLNLFVITAYRLGQNLKELAWIPGIITGLCLVLIVPCSMRWGLIGVGIGWLIGQALGSAVALFYFLRSNSAAKRHEGLEVMQ